MVIVPLNNESVSSSQIVANYDTDNEINIHDGEDNDAAKELYWIF